MDIAITIGKTTIDMQTKGYRSLVEAFHYCDGENSLFYWRCSNLPKTPVDEIEHVYVVIGNRMRWKCKVASYLKNATIKFHDGRAVHSKGWMLLFDFEAIPRNEQISRRGFQGFRYLPEGGQ